ncbi:MAG: hypothetical protein GMKNLPBB_01402 [Myxococcota bacterium]|nr:hypothetical protein [Myxococcota bacterium]
MYQPNTTLGRLPWCRLTASIAQHPVELMPKAALQDRPIAKTVPLILAVMVFLGLAVWRCSNWTCKHDEGVTFDQAIGRISREVRHGPVPLADAIDRHGVWDVPNVMTARGMHPPAYYMGFNVWTRLFGTSAGAMLAYGVLLGAVSIVGAWLLAGALTRTYAAQVIAAALFAVSPAHLQYATIIRPYGSLIGMTLFATWALVRYFDARDRNQEWRWLLIFAGLTTLGMYWVYHYLFVAVWHFAVLGLTAIAHPHESRWRSSVMVICSGLVVVAGVGPWLPVIRWQSYLQRSHGFITGSPPIGDVLRQVRNHLERFTFNSAPGEWLFMGLRWLLLAATAVLICRLLAAWWQDRRFILLLALPIWPLAIYTADVLNNSYTIMVERYCSAMIGIVLIVIAAACGMSRWQRFGRVVAICWCAMLADIAIGQARLSYASGTVRAARQIAEHAARYADPVIVISTAARGSAWPLLVELDRLAVKKGRIHCPANPADADLPGAIFVELDRDDDDTRWTNDQLEGIQASCQ